jgi:hypothetical protein
MTAPPVIDQSMRSKTRRSPFGTFSTASALAPSKSDEPMEFSVDDYFPDELGPHMTPEEVNADLYLWLTLDREDLWRWYRELAKTEPRV